MTASVSTFVPKPHTPFQWAAQIDVAETGARQSLLRRELSRRHIRFKWHDARTSYLEGVFSRGDRRLGTLLLAAYRLGCRFDGWTEFCRFDLWERAFRETGIEPAHYLRRRFLNEVLPWDHLSSGVTKQFLQRELALAVEGRLTPDCSIERCTYCGACDFKTVRNVTYHVHGAKGSEHRGGAIDNWAQVTVQGGDGSGSWEPRGWHKIRGRRRGDERQVPGAGRPAGEADRGPAADRPQAPPAPSRGLGNAEEWLSAASEGLVPPVALEDPAAPRLRVRVTYRKLDRARFISHLELIQVFARAARRAGLPLAFSRGFHPQPRMRFSPGLPLGAESECEVLDIDLTADLDAAEVGRAFGAQLPEGFSVVEARAIALRAPSPEHGLNGFRYDIAIDGLFNGDGGSWIDERLDIFRGAASFAVRKHTGKGDREIDARPLVRRLQRPEPTRLELDVCFSSAGSIKPSDLLAAVLGIDAAIARALPMRKTHAFYDDAPAPEPRAATLTA